jgi:hypothetical protein
LFLARHYSGDQKAEERDGWGTQHVRGGDERYVQYFNWGNLRDRDTLQDLGADLRIILICISKKSGRVKEWINLVKDRDSSGLL